MIDNSDYVIAYVTHPTGGAYQAVKKVKRLERQLTLIENITIES